MGHIGLVKWLLDEGANPRLCDDDNHTAFFVAAGGGFRDLAVLLYEEGGVDVDDVDIHGLTALDWAREKGTSFPEDSEEFKAIEATIEWLLHQRASPCACAAFQLYPAAASGSSEAPVPANSAVPAEIRSSEPALALAMTTNHRRQGEQPRPRQIRIIIPGEEGAEEESPSVEFEASEALEEEEWEYEESLEPFEGRSILSLSTGDSIISLFDSIVAVGEEHKINNYDSEASILNRRVYIRAPYVDYREEDQEDDEWEDEEGLPTSSPFESSLESFEGRSFFSLSTGDSAISYLDEVDAAGEAFNSDYAHEI